MDTDQVSLRRLTRRQLWIAALVLTLGAALRIGMLASEARFHPDEALYATFARQISQHGDLLLSSAPLDKPPLALLITAASFSIFGPTEFAARLPSIFASLLTLAAVQRLARRLYGDKAAWAGLLLALSSFDLAFTATAFLDPLLTLWLLLACLAASLDRWRISGLMLILAVATKQSALLFVPIIVGLGIARNLRDCWTWRDLVRHLRSFVLPILVGGLLLILWSVARAAPTDFWTLGAVNNNPGRLIRANEVIPRLERWLDLLSFIPGFWPLLILAALPPLIGLSSRTYRRDRLIDLVLGIGILGSLLVYWLAAVNVYDRYLHTLAPLILLLVTRGARQAGKPVGLVAALCMIPFTVVALSGQLTIGGDHGQHTGVDQLAATLNRLPGGSVVYDYWLGWELGYYLGNPPAVRVIFEPSPQALARAVCADSADQYFTVPPGAADAWLAPLLDRGGAITLLRDGPFRLYRLSCVW